MAVLSWSFPFSVSLFLPPSPSLPLPPTPLSHTPNLSPSDAHSHHTHRWARSRLGRVRSRQSFAYPMTVDYSSLSANSDPCKCSVRVAPCLSRSSTFVASLENSPPATCRCRSLSPQASRSCVSLRQTVWSATDDHRNYQQLTSPSSPFHLPPALGPLPPLCPYQGTIPSFRGAASRPTST